MNTSMHEQLVSLPTAAKRLDISVRSLYRLIARKEIPAPIKVGGSAKLTETDLSDYIERIKAGRK